jgi:hypothetical protein
MISLTRSLSISLYRSIPYRAFIFARNMGNMSDPSIAKLPFPLKDLVLGATPDLGKSDQDNTEITEWIEKVAQGDIAMKV